MTAVSKETANLIEKETVNLLETRSALGLGDTAVDPLTRFAVSKLKYLESDLMAA